LTGLKQSKDVPAVRAFVKKASIQGICDIVEKALGNETKMTRNIKIFLCHKYTGQKLRTIGETFGIGDSAVSQVFKRFGNKIEQDRQLKKKIRTLEKTIKTSNVETPLCS
jgi:chromosomal replication initiation ATPase DnaA